GFLANEKIEKIVINISVVAAPEITATVVDTQKLAITVPQRTDYSTDPLEFDLEQTLSDLGIASMSEIEAVVTYDTDESITDITATGNVFWYDLESKYGAWGANASVFVNYESTDLSYVSIGQYPDNVDSMLSYTYTVYYGFMANDKIEMLEVAVTIREAEIVQNLSVEVVPNTSYAIDTVEFDLNKTLTDLGITDISEATIIGFNEDGSYTDSYTADDGFWTARNGYVSTWGGGGVAYTAYGILPDSLIGVGQFPDSLHVGETAKAMIGFLANEKIEKIVINISVVAA
ncbi:DUF4859 domain-containing protein, partial [Saccharicrinis sp. FJH62]|uniref:DUF4859 domain-containing protein n=1 Tax=Saccharicrinis sp. FJH62 TaxID=3344657 RepID=UPI0035D4508D